MAKAIQKTDIDVQSVDQMVDRMGQRLSVAYEALNGQPEAQAAIVAVWESVQQLQRVNAEKDMVAQVMKATMQAALDEAIEQRNFAVIDAKLWEADARGWQDELKQWSNHGVEKAQERLAGAIAAATGMPLTSVERVLAVVLGDRETIEESAWEEYLEAFSNLDNSLYVEEMFNRYTNEGKEPEAEEETED